MLLSKSLNSDKTLYNHQFINITENEINNFKNLIVPMVILIVPILLVVSQPDLGTSILIGLSGLVVLWLSGVNANDLLIKLDIDGFGISTGAACSSGVNKTSSVLKAIGLDAKSASSVIRISLGKYTKETDLISFVDSLSKNVKIIRNEKK